MSITFIARAQRDVFRIVLFIAVWREESGDQIHAFSTTHLARCVSLHIFFSLFCLFSQAAEKNGEKDEKCVI